LLWPVLETLIFTTKKLAQWKPGTEHPRMSLLGTKILEVIAERILISNLDDSKASTMAIPTPKKVMRIHGTLLLLLLTAL